MTPALRPDTVLWRFACPHGHGEFDVWAWDWGDVDVADRPEWMRSAGTEIENRLAITIPASSPSIGSHILSLPPSQPILASARSPA